MEGISSTRSSQSKFPLTNVRRFAAEKVRGNGETCLQHNEEEKNFDQHFEIRSFPREEGRQAETRNEVEEEESEVLLSGPCLTCLYRALLSFADFLYLMAADGDDSRLRRELRRCCKRSLCKSKTNPKCQGVLARGKHERRSLSDALSETASALAPGSGL